ncbi:protein of unknown function [Methylocaldum szegediense]|uniref:Uncharacterized protein n=1 Tax=Methylocaldum szegediense TaxID=73780 RepID=A0ABM9I0D4_9GAMM|nr:protein of unknown function [Methylocaldum szegediense]
MRIFAFIGPAVVGGRHRRESDIRKQQLALGLPYLGPIYQSGRTDIRPLYAILKRLGSMGLE